MYRKTRDPPQKIHVPPNLISLDRKKGQKTDYKKRETDRQTKHREKRREGRRSEATIVGLGFCKKETK